MFNSTRAYHRSLVGLSLCNLLGLFKRLPCGMKKRHHVAYWPGRGNGSVIRDISCKILPVANTIHRYKKFLHVKYNARFEKALHKYIA